MVDFCNHLHPIVISTLTRSLVIADGPSERAELRRIQQANTDVKRVMNLHQPFAFSLTLFIQQYSEKHREHLSKQ